MFDHTLIKILATSSRKENSSTQFGGIRCEWLDAV